MKSIYKGHEFKGAIEHFYRKVFTVLFPSQRFNTIYWSDSISTAAINGKGLIQLADVKDHALVNHAVLEQYCGFILHELLHWKYTDFKAHDGNQYIDRLHNAIEDIWIERKGIAAKITGNIEHLFTALCKTMGDKALAEVTNWSDPAQYPFVLAMYGRTYAPNMPLASGLEDIFDQACAKIDACKNSQETLNLARWVYDQLQMLDNTPSKRQKPSSSPDQAEGEGEGAGDQSKPSSGSADKAGKKPSDSPSAGKAKAPTSKTEAVQVEPSIQAPKGAAGSGAYCESDKLYSNGAHVGSHPDARFAVKTNVPARLRYEVKRMFENTGLEEFQLKRKAGALNVHALPSVAMGSSDVFKRRLETEGVDSAVVILLDVSGSMFCDLGNDNAERMTAAIQTTAALLDTLTKAGVSTCVMTFGSHTSILKPFDMNARKAIPMLECIQDGGSTNDYFAIRYAHKLLLKRPEQRRVVFAITDGDGNRKRAKEQVASGERLGITTIGVGVQYDVSNVYPKHINIQNVADLGTASFKQIKLAA